MNSLAGASSFYFNAKIAKLAKPQRAKHFTLCGLRDLCTFALRVSAGTGNNSSVVAVPGSVSAVAGDLSRGSGCQARGAAQE